MKTISDNPSIYVGTYAAYNAGSLHGAWLSLDDYVDAEEFYTACKQLHKTESDPEFMFQDWENIPERFISESHIDPEFWEYMEKVNNSYLDAEIWDAAEDCDIEDPEEAYSGTYNNDADFAYGMAEQLGELNESANWPYTYTGKELNKSANWPYTCIDWERAGRELNKSANWPYTCIDWEHAGRELMYDYCKSNHHYFRSV